MREISLETQEILKSQKMLGANKFNYELKLEGVDFYSDIQDIKINTVIIGNINDKYEFSDYVIRADGKVLLAYINTNKIYLKVIESENEMLTITDSGAEGDIFYSLVSYNIDHECFSMIRLKNGKILLFINDIGSLTNNIVMGTRVFISNNGLGNDFQLATIIKPFTRTTTSTLYNKRLVSKATQDSKGNIWIAVTGDPYNYGSNDASKILICKSSDGGMNWSIKYSRAESTNLYYDYFRSMVAIDEVIYCSSTYSSSSKITILHISYDFGESWQGITSNFQNLPIQFTEDPYWRYLLDWHHGIDGKLYMLMGTPTGTDIYTAKSVSTINYDYLDNINNWDLVYSLTIGDALTSGFFTISPIGTIHYLHVYAGRTIRDIALLREEYSAPIKASSISISKGRGGANSLSLSIDNSNGAVNPFNPQNPLYGIVGLNKQIIVKQGYGQELIETFTGRIDTFNMKSFPHTMEIQCRDNLKKALDQTITEGGKNTVFFESQPIENIFGYLCYLAGIETGEIEETGINISKEFSWQSYADAFQFLADLASFEYGADEYGKVYFRRDFQPEEIEIAYTFEEGIDITSLSYELSDKDLYSVVKVYGKNGDNVISYSAPFPDAAKYNILPQKILKVDATEAATINELKKIADRSIYLMNSRTAVVNFNAIAVPWLQVGDFIQVNETSSMSAGIYRISSLNLKMDNSNFFMDLQCYYYGDSVEIGTLPEDTATQTPNAELNLIPEMTSNTAPAGVARASSVLKLYENDYQPWNALNSTSDDLFWNCVSPYGWIEYQFTEKTIVDKYTLKARQAIDYNRAMPKNFTFEGFDGEKWIVLDTRSNQTAWGIHEVRSYEFNNTVAYSKYRLNVTANNGFTRLQLEQLGMFYRGGV